MLNYIRNTSICSKQVSCLIRGSAADSNGSPSIHGIACALTSVSMSCPDDTKVSLLHLMICHSKTCHRPRTSSCQKEPCTRSPTRSNGQQASQWRQAYVTLMSYLCDYQTVSMLFSPTRIPGYQVDSLGGGGRNLLCSLHPALFVPALHDRPCFSCRITLPCFDYLYPISRWTPFVLHCIH